MKKALIGKKLQVRALITGAPPETRTPNPRIKSRLGLIPVDPYGAGQSVDGPFRPDSWRNPVPVFPSGADVFVASEHTRSTHVRHRDHTRPSVSASTNLRLGLWSAAGADPKRGRGVAHTASEQRKRDNPPQCWSRQSSTTRIGAVSTDQAFGLLPACSGRPRRAGSPATERLPVPPT